MRKAPRLLSEINITPATTNNPPMTMRGVIRSEGRYDHQHQDETRVNERNVPIVPARSASPRARRPR
jgi:hypothetical protein